MSQGIFLVHGRSTKPARDAYFDLQKRALIDGLRRVDPDKAAKVENGEVAVHHCYYGDINNEILAKHSKRDSDRLTATDPASGNARCEPVDGIAEAIDALRDMPSFTKARYKRVLKDNKDWRFLDDAARALSTVSALASGTFLNMKVIKHATADLGLYLLTRKVGSAIRDRLQAPLKEAIRKEDDICLVSHSMGCIVSYDVLWKFSRMSEYAEFQRPDQPIVNKWITLGSPLGEAGVRRNLYDDGERGEDRFPYKAIGDWVNVAAHDDFIAHDPTHRDDFKEMRSYGYVKSIRDLRIYNCYAHHGKANAHKLYGYLAHDRVGREIADWIK